jgi:hypothetical protein
LYIAAALVGRGAGRRTCIVGVDESRSKGIIAGCLSAVVVFGLLTQQFWVHRLHFGFRLTMVIAAAHLVLFVLIGGALPPRIDRRLLERQARERLRDCRSLLQRQVANARELLREILVAPIRFTPFAIGARKGYRFEGEAAIGGLLRGLVDVPPTAKGVPGGDRFVVDRLNTRFSGEFDVNRAA